MIVTKVLLGLTLAVVANAQVGAQVQKWGQCGGIGFLGPTICVSGSTCTILNAFEKSGDWIKFFPDSHLL
ncbi:hypothetical protein TWF192_009133 [Orbilia oligospora]|uniref:CBM1 domain-containing protein n=1 Tax=Orbilia oligospora TaxID=2813651 RepID=A0A6G1MKU9_ORBOL|nr:hypothetical protein TWF679_001889 [Orbilia oligospora]KAF3220050.1 hypothetical protein TWF191_007621 [Orbilia oligospora]KAF3261201.1 hypothetical protein TWF192_009133 [Orbilia oligospora]